MFVFSTTPTTAATTTTKAPGTRYENMKNKKSMNAKYIPCIRKYFVWIWLQVQVRVPCFLMFFIVFSTTTTKAPGARYEKMNIHTYVIPVRNKQVVLWCPVDTVYSRTYILGVPIQRACSRSSLYSQWLLVQSGDISRASSTNSKRLWTRAEVNRGANKGPPQTSSRPKSMVFRWCARDRPQCTHTRYTHTREERTTILNNGALWADVLGFSSQVPAPSWPWDTERRSRFAPTSVPHYTIRLCLGIRLALPFPVAQRTTGTTFTTFHWIEVLFRTLSSKLH